ncbi:MAG: site-specific DNA-methyltransferase [Fimbriimonas sp.]|nr:site-specific DNA-methyltransferase [Fimbriimonas sp.]
MPELDFKGKEFVRNHHLTVPFRPLVPDAEKSVGEPDLNGNLIIQGDNLEALKSLLPMYAGKVDCIFIDPPYNTGNEGWCYNDNVNSPTLKQWFSENPVGIDDSLRHDKWCAMMWPRLKLLWELLADTGSLWMTLDDNEAPKARILLDEIFGADSFVVNVAWQNKVSPANDAKQFSDDHDSLMVYAKHPDWQPSRLERNAEQLGYYSNPDSDTRGPWNSATYTCNKTKEERPSLFYPLNRPDGTEVWPSETAVWAYSKDASAVHVAEDRIYWGANSTGQPRLKVFLSEVRGVVPRSVWSYSDSGHTQMATQELRQLMGSVEFATPKPLQLLSKVISIAASKPEAIILDSFAGSGTTAHAVIKANAAGGGYAQVHSSGVRRLRGHPYGGAHTSRNEWLPIPRNPARDVNGEAAHLDRGEERRQTCRGSGKHSKVTRREF